MATVSQIFNNSPKLLIHVSTCMKIFLHPIEDSKTDPNVNFDACFLVFNLSAYLAGAPPDTAALTLIPLITILSAATGY